MALISNFDKVKEHQDEMSASIGNAKQKFDEVYSESLQAKLSDLQRSFEGLYEAFLKSNTLGTGIDSLTGFINGISSITNTLGTLPTVLTATVGAMSLFNAKFRESNATMVSLTPLIGGVQTKFKILEQDLIKQASAFKNSIANINKYNNSTEQIGPPIANAGKSLLGLNSQLALTNLKLMAVKASMLALQVAMSMALTMGITLLISGFTKLVDAIVMTDKELKELNQEFISTNSNSNTSKVIDLINSYEKLEDKLATLKEGTSEYKSVEDELVSTQESIVSIYPSASNAIDSNTEAKRLNLEATKELIGKELELSKAGALDVLEKNDTKTDVGLDEAITQYEEYYKVLEQVNKLAEDDVTKSINIESNLSDSGKLTVNAKDVDVYKKRVENLNATLEASYEAFKILGVSNDEYAEKAKKVGEALGYTATETSKLINELDKSNVEDVDTSKSQSSVSELDSVYKALGYSVDDASERIKELNALSSEDKSAEVVKDATKAYGEAIDKTKEYTEMLNNVNELTSMTPEMISQLASKYPELGANITDVASVQEFLNNKISESVQAQVDAYTQMVANDNEYYNSKIRNNQEIIESVNQLASQFVDSQGNAYSIDLNNYSNLAQLKAKLTNDLGEGVAQFITNFVSGQSAGYGVDLKNTASYASSKAKILAQLNAQIKKLSSNMESALGKIQSSAYTGMTAGDAEAEKLYIMASNQLKTAKAQYQEIQTEFSTYSSGFSGYTPSFGSSSFGGSGSGSGNKGSGSGSSSSEKVIEDMDSLVDRYVDLNNAITKVENALDLLNIAQENASDEEKLSLIKQEINLLNQKRVALENLRKEQQKELSELKSSLASSGFKFNSDGSISNINSQLETLRQNANKLSGEAKESAIENVKQIQSSVEAYNDLLLETVPETESSIKEISNTIIDSQKDIADILEKQKDKYIENLEKETDALKSELEKRKSLLEKEWEEEDYKDELAEKQKQLNDLEDSLALALRTGDEELIKSIRLQITESQQEIDTFIRDNERDSISERFDEEIDSVDKKLEEQINMINEKLSDEELLKLVQLGVTDLNDTLDNITNSTNKVKSTFASVGDIISNNWIEGLNNFVTKLTSLETLMPNLGFSLNGISGGVNNITINSDLIIQGNVDEGVMPDLKKAISSIKDEIITEIANKMTR